jgi:sugar lactone lactonase YvrE
VKAELLWDCRCALGEGVVWNEADRSLYFVDIDAQQVLACDADGGAQRRWAMPEPIGWLLPRRGGGWVGGFARGVANLSLQGGGVSDIEWLHRLHDDGSPLRLNDGKADAAGRAWFGSMHRSDHASGQGVLYRWRAGAAPEVVDRGYGVTNGPTFSVDGGTMYHTDTVKRCIYAFDVSADGALSNKRVWCGFGRGEGFPDGMTTDADGAVWVAHWGGARITRRDAGGAVVQTIDVHAPQVTNVAFGGPGLRDLFISTARTGLDAAALSSAPHAGALFVLRDAGRGLAPNPFNA